MIHPNRRPNHHAAGAGLRDEASVGRDETVFLRFHGLFALAEGMGLVEVLELGVREFPKERHRTHGRGANP